MAGSLGTCSALTLQPGRNKTELCKFMITTAATTVTITITVVAMFACEAKSEVDIVAGGDRGWRTGGHI